MDIKKIREFFRQFTEKLWYMKTVQHKPRMQKPPADIEL